MTDHYLTAFSQQLQSLSGRYPLRRDRLLLSLFVLVAGVLRLAFVGNPVWRDEEITMQLVSEMGARGLLVDLPLVQPHFPLFYLLLEGWDTLGNSLVEVRILSVIAGAVLPLAVYLLGREHSQRVGLLAGGLAAVSPPMVHIGWWLRPYSLFAFLTCACGFLLLRRAWALFGVASVAAVYTHPFGIFALGVWTAWTAIERDQEGLLTNGAVWVAASPGIALLAQKVLMPTSAVSAAQVAHLASSPSLLQVLLTPAAVTVGTLYVDIQVALGAVFLGFIAVGAWQSRDERLVRLASLWATSIIAGVALLAQIHPIYQLKYLVWVGIPMFVLTASTRQTLGRYPGLVFDTVVVILVVSNLAALISDGLLMANFVSPTWTGVEWL